MATSDAVTYRRGELGDIASADAYKLKITADRGATKWLTISPKEFAGVRDVLLTEDTAESGVSVEDRIKTALAYMAAVTEPNKIALKHIRRILTGEHDPFVRLWMSEAPGLES